MITFVNSVRIGHKSGHALSNAIILMSTSEVNPPETISLEGNRYQFGKNFMDFKYG